MHPNARCLTVAIADCRLRLTSSTICPRSADIALSFVLNYGSDLFQASFLLSSKLLLSVRGVQQRLNLKILRHFRFSPPRTSDSFFFFFFFTKMYQAFLGKSSNQRSLGNITIVCSLQMSDTAHCQIIMHGTDLPGFYKLWHPALHRVNLSKQNLKISHTRVNACV